MPIHKIIKRNPAFYRLLIISILLCQPVVAQWTWQNPLPTGQNYLGCDFINPVKGWIAGGWGCIIRTLDGGDTWELPNSGVLSDLYGVYSLDENYGWAVGNGGTILHTKNGGGNWIIQQSGSGSGSYITSV